MLVTVNASFHKMCLNFTCFVQNIVRMVTAKYHCCLGLRALPSSSLSRIKKLSTFSHRMLQLLLSIQIVSSTWRFVSFSDFLLSDHKFLNIFYFRMMTLQQLKKVL